MHRVIAGHDQLKHSESHLVALVTMGNPLRGDDAIASHLLAGLPPRVTESLCILDAGSYTRDLPEFMHGHDVGIVVDAAETNEPVVLDLSDVAKRQKVMLDSSHALSWLDEIVLYQDEFLIPKRLLFFGLPTYEVAWHEGLSRELEEKLPPLVKQLCQLIECERTKNA